MKETRGNTAGTHDKGSRKDKLLAAVCRICPLCAARRKWPHGAYGRLTRRLEAVCPFCRAYDRLYGSTRKSS